MAGRGEVGRDVRLGKSNAVQRVDRARSQLTNVSVWDSLENAEPMSSFQPMLNLGKRFAADGATFLQPIPNFDGLWQWGDIGGAGAPLGHG
jgi:hypothetical protein